MGQRYRVGVDLDLISEVLADQPSYRSQQVWEWAARGATSYGEMTNLPAALRGELEAAVPFSTLELEHQAESRDGTVKALFRTHDAHRVEAVLTRNGRRLTCDFVVVGAGIVPNVELARDAGIAVDDGIVVDTYGRTSVAAVFASGDVANHEHPLFGRLRVEHYNNAEKMGRAVAQAMLGRLEPYDYLHSFWSDQYEDKLEYIGFTRRWDRFAVRGSLEERRFLGFYFSGGRLLAALGLNRGGDPELDESGELAACGRVIAAGGRVDPAQLEDERIDIRAMLV